MDADGSGRERLDASNLAALSEVGCVTCIYPPTPPDSGISFDNEAFWQPTPVTFAIRRRYSVSAA